MNSIVFDPARRGCEKNTTMDLKDPYGNLHIGEKYSRQ